MTLYVLYLYSKLNNMGQLDYSFKIEKKSGESFTDAELLLLESVVYNRYSKLFYGRNFENSFSKYDFLYKKGIRFPFRGSVANYPTQVDKIKIKKTEKELKEENEKIKQEFEKLVEPLFNRYKKDIKKRGDFHVENLYDMLDSFTLDILDDDFDCGKIPYFTKNKRGDKIEICNPCGYEDENMPDIEDSVRDIVKYIFRPLGFIMNGTVEVKDNDHVDGDAFKIGVKVTDNRIKVKEVSMSDDLFD